MKERESWYIKNLEMRSLDLQKAEAEVCLRHINFFIYFSRCISLELLFLFLDVIVQIQVDILGDEADALRGILGKIYMALDYYSPVLLHYPGVSVSKFQAPWYIYFLILQGTIFKYLN